jgi:hypothetical protein
VDLIGSRRWVVALALVGGGVAPGQGTLPATAPTSLSAPANGVAGASKPSAMVTSAGAGDSGLRSGAANERHDAVVLFASGKVEVVADGSSLNQILREIGRVTGMKIRGDVADEPVYGRYGPGPASEILSTLLDGTGSNMLLLEATATAPGELILTQRTGGVTPPDPNAPSPRAGYVEPNVPGSRNYQRPREAWMGPQPSGSGANGQPGNNPGGQPGNNSGQGGGNTDRPNPQQIYQQLQRLQQTQQTPPETQQRPQ